MISSNLVQTPHKPREPFRLLTFLSVRKLCQRLHEPIGQAAPPAGVDAQAKHQAGVRLLGEIVNELCGNFQD
jgi:hypothetical protein